jgi:hypothetical protein
MLRWFRHSASRVAAILLVAMATLGQATLLPHADDCHDPCVVFAVEHDAAAHRFEAAAAAADAHPLHCVVCHWARGFRPDTEVRITHGVGAAAGTLVHVDSTPAVRPSIAAQPPLRSPPVSPAPLT